MHPGDAHCPVMFCIKGTRVIALGFHSHTRLGRRLARKLQSYWSVVEGARRKLMCIKTSSLALRSSVGAKLQLFAKHLISSSQLISSADSLATSLPTHCLSAAGNFLHFSPSCNGLARQYRREGRSSTVSSWLSPALGCTGVCRQLAETRAVLCYTDSATRRLNDSATRRLNDSATRRLIADSTTTPTQRLNDPSTRPSAYFATRR